MRFAITQRIPTLQPRNPAAVTTINLQQLFTGYECNMYQSN